MTDTKFSRVARSVTEFSGSVYATTFAFATVGVWIVGGGLYYGFGDFYQLVINTFTTIVTFLMVFLIQHTQNHDTRALHLKMDELLLTTKKADNRLINIEELDEEQLSALRERYKEIGQTCRDADITNQTPSSTTNSP